MTHNKLYLRGFALTTGLAWALFSLPAHAFICSRVPNESGQETGSSLSWFTRNLSFALNQDGTLIIGGTAELDELRDSFDVWADIELGAQAQIDCGGTIGTTDITFTEGPLTDSTFVGYNQLDPNSNRNLLLFHDGAWPYPEQQGLVIGLTTTTFSPITGELIDADIEFNSADFDFTTNPQSVSDTDLKNTAVHEIGHFIGLGHTGVQDATMFGNAAGGETKKRDLDCDDAEALVFKYPAGQPNGYCGDTINAACGFCAPPNTFNNVPSVNVVSSNDGLSACSTGGIPPAIWLLLGSALLLAQWQRRRHHKVRSRYLPSRRLRRNRVKRRAKPASKG